MDFLTFKQQFFDLACFNVNQVYAWRPGFDRNNLSRWVQKGYLVRLRQGWYAFPEYRNKPGYALYFANRIYSPSCISLHTALSHYGIIPEATFQITSITTLKTRSFSNAFGEYTYKSVKPALFFGFVLKELPDGRTFRLATPEKALIDLLYLYPEYNTARELQNLRLDDDYMQSSFNWHLLSKYAIKTGKKMLKKRTETLKKIFADATT